MEPIGLEKLAEPVEPMELGDGTIEEGEDPELRIPDEVELDVGIDEGTKLDKTGDMLLPAPELGDVVSSALAVLDAKEKKPLLEIVTNEDVCIELL